MTRKDRNALSHCLQQVEADAKWRENFKARKARGDDWLERAHSACAILQSRNMQLAPWQLPPCDSAAHPFDDRYPEYEARKLEARAFADEMRRAGLSIYEGDPQAALAAAAEARRQALHVVEPGSVA